MDIGNRQPATGNRQPATGRAGSPPFGDFGAA